MTTLILILCLCLAGCATDNPFKQELQTHLQNPDIKQSLTTEGERPTILISASADKVKNAIEAVLTQKGIPIESVTNYQILSGWIPSKSGIPLTKEQMQFFIEPAADNVKVHASCVQQISVLYGTNLYTETTKGDTHRDELTLMLILIKREAEASTDKPEEKRPPPGSPTML